MSSIIYAYYRLLAWIAFKSSIEINCYLNNAHNFIALRFSNGRFSMIAFLTNRIKIKFENVYLLF